MAIGMNGYWLLALGDWPLAIGTKWLLAIGDWQEVHAGLVVW
jgi:hypothetical protein